jgi:hypothetical protein
VARTRTHTESARHRADGRRSRDTILDTAARTGSHEREGAGELEQVLDQVAEPLALTVDHVELGRLGRVGLCSVKRVQTNGRFVSAIADGCSCRPA